MTETSANDLERVEIELSRIARDYITASQQLDQYVITLEGAVSHVMEAGPQGWKGLSSAAFVAAWLERKTRMQQASLLLNEVAGYLTRMAHVIEDNVPLIRAEQSIQLQPVFQSMSSTDQQSVLNAESQAQQAIMIALAALNGQLEQLGEEIGDCPQEDREAGEPWYERNISRNDAGGSGGSAKTPEQRIEDAVGDPVLAELLIEQANMKGANLEDVAALLEHGVGIDQVDQWLQDGVNLEGAGTLLNKSVDVNLVSQWIEKGVNLQDAAAVLDKGVSADTVDQWIANKVNLQDAATLLNKGVSPDAISGLSQQGVDLKNAGNYVDAMRNKGFTIGKINEGIENNIASLDAKRWKNISSQIKSLISDAIDRWANGRTRYLKDGTPFDNSQRINNEGKPVTPVPPRRGPYTEYTVAEGVDRGVMRIVVDHYGNIYFFEAHYNVNQGGGIPVSLRDIINSVR